MHYKRSIKYIFTSMPCAIRPGVPYSIDANLHTVILRPSPHHPRSSLLHHPFPSPSQKITQ